MEASDKYDARTADYQPETPWNYATLNTFAELTAHLRTRNCRLCGEFFFSSELDVRTLFQDWADGIVDQLSCNIRCGNCRTRICIACEPVPFTKSSRIGLTSPKRNQSVSWCCVGGRLFLIWALLCGFDRHIRESRDVRKISQQAKPELKSHQKTKKSTRGGGFGSGGGDRPPIGPMPSGLGYGGHSSGGHDHDMFEGGDYEDDSDSYSDYETGIDANGDYAALNKQMFGKIPDLSKLSPGHIANSKKRAPPPR
jgi:hypothetical protein